MALIINGIRVAGIGANGTDGAGVPIGGTEGQVLIKKTVTDYDTEWTDLPSIDQTLSIEGCAADAKATGSQLSILNSLVGDTSVSSQISSAISSKSDSDHLHNDVYYTKEETDNLTIVITDDQVDQICI